MDLPDEYLPRIDRTRAILWIALGTIVLLDVLDLLYARGGTGRAWGLEIAQLAVALVAFRAVRVRARERNASARRFALQTHVLEMIARGTPLARVLEAVAELVEAQDPDVLCSVLLLEGDRLRHGAAPRLPRTYTDAFDGVVIGPEVGSCGSAAYWRESVVVRDIATDPRWTDFRDLALRHGLRACWSVPITDGEGACIGTFALYFREPREPDREQRRLVAVAAHLAGVAIEHARTEDALASSTRQLEEESRIASTLARVGQEMISALSTPLVLERLCQLTTELLECDVSDTLLRLPQGGVYVVNSAHGYAPEEVAAVRGVRLPAERLAPLVDALHRKPVVQSRTERVEDATCRQLLEQFGIRVTLYAALRRGDELVGLLSAGFRGRDAAFTPLLRRIAHGIAQIASMALENARLVEELQRASQLKSEFVSTMSHELRTPLSVIIGYTDMLRDDPGEADQAQTLSRIRGSSLELLELIEATLNVNRIEAGKDPPEFQIVAMSELLGELASEFEALPRETGVELRWETVQGLEVCTDRRKLKIVFKNLVGNALKFTPAGSVVVSVRADVATWGFTVRDTGVGIAPQHLPIIFEMFRQGDSSDARSYSGVGLGLYIVRRLVTQLGGSITVESAQGTGTTFTVTFPRANVRALLSAAG